MGIKEIQYWVLGISALIVTFFSLSYYNVIPLKALESTTSIMLIQVFSAILSVAFMVHIIYQLTTGGWRDFIGVNYTSAQKFVYWSSMALIAILCITAVIIGAGAMGLTFIYDILPSWIIQSAIPLRALAFHLVIAVGIVHTGTFISPAASYDIEDYLDEHKKIKEVIEAKTEKKILRCVNLSDLAGGLGIDIAALKKHLKLMEIDDYGKFNNDKKTFCLSKPIEKLTEHLKEKKD